MKRNCALLFVCLAAAGQDYRPVGDIALAHTLKAVPGANAGSLYIAKEFTDAHNGVTHILYRQRFQGVDVLNAAWTVNLDSQGRVLNAGGRLYGAPVGALPDPGSAPAAARTAARTVNPAAAARYKGFFSGKQARLASGVRLAGESFGDDIDGRMVWYAVNGSVHPAWVFYITDTDGVSGYATVVDADSNLAMERRPITRFQKAQGTVFTRESPYPNPAAGTLLTGQPPFADRVAVSFAGDPVASPAGWVTSNETAGNNVIAGENLPGTLFLTTATRATAADLDFSFPLQLGPGALNPLQYAPAVTTNLFYWANRAHDLHYASGFREAAGNFQTENFGRGGVGGDALSVYSHYGAQAPGRPQLENAFYRSVTGSGADGETAMVSMFLSLTGRGGYYLDGSLDAAVIIHEYTHGVSERLLPQGYDTFQIGAMAEAWSDFYALEFTLPEGAPVDGSYAMGEYFVNLWGQGIRSRPYSTDLAINPLTFADIGNVISFPEVHADGEIWFEALWEMRANLIAQFGDKEGRRRVRLLVLDGMKFAPPFSTMVDMRDAILLADRTDFAGASQSRIWAAFAKRGLGATAFSTTGDTVHVHSSFEVPSKKGQVAFYDKQITVGEPLTVIVSDLNNTAESAKVDFVGNSGDVESLVLVRQGSVFVGRLATSGNVVTPGNSTLNLINGDNLNVYYTDFDTGAGGEQVYTTITARPGYTFSSSASTFEVPASERSIAPGTRFELPFAFPFYDQKYRSVFVDEGGILMFGDTRVFVGCTDRSALSEIPAIAPFWLNLTTLGSALPREGIFYVQKDPNTVTFRWAAETLTPFSAPGGPVNFSATLQDDGVIIFNYGTGNSDFTGMSVPAGCGAGPTVGLSPGHDTYTQAVAARSFTSAPALRWDPPLNPQSLPTAVIESPKADDHVQDILTVTGVAWDDTSRATRVDFLVDGVQRGSATPSAARADFCATRNVPGCPAVGFSSSLRLTGVAPGPHQLRVRVSSARGAYQDFPPQPMTFQVDAGQGSLPFGKIEAPVAGATVSGTVTVRGYAAINDLRIASVDTIIDGVTFGPTTYGVSRTDVCNVLTPRPLNCPGIGFQVSINTRTGVPPLPDGEHTIQIRVRDQTGRYTLLPDTVAFTVKNGDYLPPVGAITSPKNGETVSGTVTITGYAYSPESTVRQVVVFFDDATFVYTATYGRPAAEVCATLPNVAACPNIGWSLTLDTAKLPNGPHVVSAQVVNARGDFTNLPMVGQPTVSIVVKNP